MKTAILLPALGLAALGLAACEPKTDAGNTAADTVTLNDDGGAALGNDDALAVGNLAADNATAPAAGNAL